MKTMRTIVGALPLAFVAACTGGDISVAIVFPNAVSQSTARRLRVEAYSPDTGAAAATARTCADFRGLAREGKDPIGTPVRGDFQCLDPCPEDWLDARVLEKVPSGKQIIYVLGYASTEEGATPVLEGCTEDFDSEGSGKEKRDVEINMELVIPDNARMVKSAGDRQVGRSGEALAVPLEVTVEADSPTGGGGAYAIPGVPIEFTTVPGYALDGDTSTFTDAEGKASIRVTLPTEPGSGDITARAEALTIVDEQRATQIFSVSVTEPVQMNQSGVVDVLTNAIPIGVAVGNLGGGAGVDVAVIGCVGQENTCAVGHQATMPFGEAALAVVLDVGQSASFPTIVPPADGLGILPSDIVVADVEGSGTDEIAFLNSRRRNSEGASIRVMRVNGNSVSPVGQGTYTMTGSNAVALAAFRQSSRSTAGLAMAAQGRSVNTQVCSRANRCLPVDLGDPSRSGCPPGERCECPECSNTLELGVCVARDKMVDILTVEQGQLVNFNGCQEPILNCNNQDGDSSTCTCGDFDLRQNSCGGRDGCNCKVPDRIYVGATDAPVLPYSLVAGPLTTPQDWDIVVPSIGGLELIEARPSQDTFVWKTEPIVNAPIHGAEIMDLDFASEDARNDPHRGDIVWFSREPCLEGSNFQDSCAVWQDLPAGQEKRGCLGAYYTDGQPSVFDLRAPEMGGCRRHHLTYKPDGMCQGEFNGDGHVDVALSSRELSEVQIFSGDGRGGLLDPPEKIPLPAGGVGGAIDCADVDGDGRDDIVVANRQTGSIYVLRTGG